VPRGGRDGAALPLLGWCGNAAEELAFGRRLEALAGLDGSQWLAVGMSIEPACGHQPSTRCSSTRSINLSTSVARHIVNGEKAN
jgi:hypothetical protein